MIRPIPPSRRTFLKTAAALGALVSLPPLAQATAMREPFKLSLAQWSLNKRFRKLPGAEPLDTLEFAATARALGFDAIEYVSQLFMDKGTDQAYLAELKQRAAGEGVKNLLIMVDREGALGDSDDAKRTQTIQNHLRWLDAAAFLGCHSIRVNAASDGRLSWDEQAKLAADGLHRLCLEADQRGLWVVVENHGGLSSHAKWLVQVMQEADHRRVGILPDFGNFYINRERGELYNPYQGLREFMPWVKESVSAKAYDWDTGAGEFYTEDRRVGREMTLDFERLVKIVLDGGYHGYIGVEYEGDKHSEAEGILRTRRALDELRLRLA